MAEPLDSNAGLEDAAPIVHSRPCDSCGAPVERGDPYCAHCGAGQPVAEKPEPARQRSFRCESCGAQVSIHFDRRSYTCPFCDSNYVVELPPETTGRQAPEFVIGFAVTRENAMERFRQWLGENSWFRPGDLKSAEIEGKLAGVYLPFWSFSMLASSRWEASIGEHWYRTETYTTRENGKTVTKTRRVRETEWWPLSGRHHQYYSMYLVSGSKSLEQNEADRIQPMHLAALKRYDPRWLAGWMNEEYTLHRDEALAICQEEFTRREQQNTAAFLPGDTHRSLRVETQFSQVQSDLILLPAYVASYRYRGKLYRFLLNGQTGKAAGSKPVSGWKVAAAVLAALAAIGGVAILAALAGQI